MPVRVLIYDDNEALRSSMEELIGEAPGMELIASMPNAETVVTDIAVLQPDVILMDIDMPGINGVEAVKLVRKVNKQLPLVMLTVFDDNDNIFNAICAGASGYILKQFAVEEIHSAIRNVLSGGAPMTGSVARKVLQMLPAARTVQQESEQLTKREASILQLLVNGHSYKMIAAELGVSIDTVRFHIKKIYDKLQVHSNTEAVSKAIKEKLIVLLPLLWLLHF